MFKKTATIVAMSALLYGCPQNQIPNDIEDDVTVAQVKFHPQQQFCIEYEHKGTLSGNSKHCMRGWGAESFTIENLKVGFGGISQEQNAHKITIGDTIYNIDPAKMTGTKTKNPFYEQLSKADPEKLSEAIMASLQMEDTGEDKQVAGITCSILKSKQLGGGGCYTDNMVMLQQDIMGVSQTATSVDLDSGGEDSDYRLYEKAKITDGPDVGAILDQL